MNHYPDEMRYRAIELRKQGKTYKEITRKLIEEFPESPLKHKKTNLQRVHHWINQSKIAKTTNKIDPTDEDLGIVEHFQLFPRPITNNFEDLSTSIPQLLEKKRKELEEIKKQIDKLELMNRILGEELSEGPITQTELDFVGS